MVKPKEERCYCNFIILYCLCYVIMLLQKAKDQTASSTTQCACSVLKCLLASSYIMEKESLSDYFCMTVILRYYAKNK